MNSNPKRTGGDVEGQADRIDEALVGSPGGGVRTLVVGDTDGKEPSPIKRTPGRQGMELWRPDWVEVYRVRGYECRVMPDVAGELLTVTRETLRLSLSAIEFQQSHEAGHNFSAAAAEIRRVLDRS